MKRFCLALTISLVLHCPMGLAHWPDQAPHRIADLGEFKFEHGGKIANLRMSYVTHGKLNAEKDNAILFIHGFALNHHQADHLIGPGRPFDTEKYFIISADELGNTQATFEHSTSPSNSGLKMKFPNYNMRDTVKAQHRLVTEALGISRLLIVTGMSDGANNSVQFSVSYPDFVVGSIPIVGGALWGTQNSFFVPLMLSNIETCEGWEGGNYEQNPQHCATNALSTIIPYFYTREWWDQYIDTPEAYTKWRKQWGHYYLDIQDTRDLYYSIMKWGLGWVGDTPGFDGDVNAVLGSIKAETLFIYSPQDQFFLPHHIDAQVEAIPNARAAPIGSTAGHLICCNADPQATHEISIAITQFLDELVAAQK